MVRVKLNDAEINIITNLCQIQIQCYIRIATNNSDEQLAEELKLIGYGITRADISEEFTSCIKKFEKIIQFPEEFFLLDATLAGVMRDLLLNYRDDFKEYEEYMPDFWHKIFLNQFVLERLN